MGIFRHKFGKSGQDQGWLPEGGFSVTNLGSLDRIGAEGAYAPAGRSHVAEGHPWGPKAPAAREASVPAPQGPRRRAAKQLELLVLKITKKQY